MSEDDTVHENEDGEVWRKGDLLVSSRCVVTLLENMPKYFRYTISAFCETCGNEHHINVTDLGTKYRRAQKVKLKSRRFIITHEALSQMLQEADKLPDGTEILSVHTDHTRDMLDLRIYNEDFDYEVVPEGGEFRSVTF